MRNLLLIVLCLIISACSGYAQIHNKEQLQYKLDSLVLTFNATIGISVIDFQTGDSVVVNNHIDFPMMSVYKFPLALAVLDKVDRKEFSLSSPVKISPELAGKFKWSPLKRQNPGVSEISVDSLLMYMVGYSDNLACDVLFDLIGGPKVAHQFIREKGIEKINILSYEAEMGVKNELTYRNSSTPLAMSLLLRDFYNGKIVKESSRKLLLNYMINDSTTSARLRGMIPDEVTIAHKTGTFASSDTVITACNDVGVLLFPDGRKYAVSIFVRDSKIPFKDTEHLIALLAYEIYLHLK